MSGRRGGEIWVVGAGAVGVLLAARLGSRGRTRLIARREETARGLRSGVRLEGALEGAARLDCLTWEEAAREAPQAGTLFIVATKASQAEAAVRQITELASGLGEPPSLLLLSNGLGLLDRVCSAVSPPFLSRISRGSVWAGARFVSAGVLGVAGIRGISWAGGNRSLLRELAPWFEEAGFPFREEEDPRGLEWRKALSNVAINPLCALARRPNGALLESPKLRGLAEMLLDEAIEVARAEGVALEQADRDRVFETARTTAGNRNSMWMDLEEGRASEIAWLNGALVALADRHGISVPGHRLLTGLIETIEERVEKAGG